ncbi:MAG: halocyanin domain-containing protein [Haloarculaceae archaeon]
MHRRDFLKTAGGAAGATAVATTGAGSAAAQSGGTPDFGGWLDDVGNYSGSVVDKTGSSEVTISVGAEGNGGNFAFDPPAVHVDTGTTVKWEWTGKGGAHNVVDDGGSFESGSPTAEAGVHLEHTFDKGGIYNYYCQPHKSLGMKGSVVVGSDYPTKGGGGGGQATEIDPEELGVPFRAHYVGFAAVLMMIVSLIFTFFLLKYGESPNTKGGNN